MQPKDLKLPLGLCMHEKYRPSYIWEPDLHTLFQQL